MRESPDFRLDRTEALQEKLLLEQYPAMLEALNFFAEESLHLSVALSHVPPVDVVKAHLTPEILEKALRLDEPALLLIPPLTRQRLVEIIDSQVGKHPLIKRKTLVYQSDNDALWSNSQQEKTDVWQVTVVTGTQDVASDPSINGRNYQRAKAWVKKYEGLGLDVINDARTYLILMMKGLAAFKPVDNQSWTVLNAKSLTEDSLVAGGDCYDVRVDLNSDNPAGEDSDLRSRGSVRVM